MKTTCTIVLTLLCIISSLTLTAQIQVGQDIDGETAGDVSGGALSFSADGTRVAIGAQFNDGNGNNSGHVRVFEFVLLV